MKIPSIKFGPKPTRWDIIAAAVLIVSAVAAAFNWVASQKQAPGTTLSGSTTFVFVLAQLAIASISLLVLGKTAKEGTLWGNLAAIGGLLVGTSGVLLAAALWVAA